MRYPVVLHDPSLFNIIRLPKAEEILDAISFFSHMIPCIARTFIFYTNFNNTSFQKDCMSNEEICVSQIFSTQFHKHDFFLEPKLAYLMDPVYFYLQIIGSNWSLDL